MALTEAFMEMDAALSAVETAVAKYTAVGHTDLDEPWDAVRSPCYEASGVYLTLTATDSPARPSAASIRQGIALLCSATEQITAFRDRHERALNSAAAILATTAAAAQAAQVAAAQARGLVGSFASYPSIRNAEEHLDATLSQLRAAQAAGRYDDVATATQQVTEATAALKTLIGAAPQRAGEATRALSSISTRIQAVRTRLDGVAPALSVLFKEFAAASSADLVNNATAARTRINEAADLFAQARSAQRRDPEEALEFAREIRTALTQAEQLIDAVPRRLQALRELREQPAKPVERVRFVLHDAQMFAVAHGLTKQWASVLDAQLQRIELLEATLNATHPDYWAYARGLDQVTDFIASVVQRMRESLSPSRTVLRPR